MPSPVGRRSPEKSRPHPNFCNLLSFLLRGCDQRRWMLLRRAGNGKAPQREQCRVRQVTVGVAALTVDLVEMDCLFGFPACRRGAPRSRGRSRTGHATTSRSDTARLPWPVHRRRSPHRGGRRYGRTGPAPSHPNGDRAGSCTGRVEWRSRAIARPWRNHRSSRSPMPRPSHAPL